MKVSLEERIHNIRTQLNMQQGISSRIALIMRLVFFTTQRFVKGAFYYLFFPSQNSFTYFNSLNYQAGYAHSYSGHTKKKRQVQATTLTMLAAVLGVMFTFTDYLAQLMPTRAAACNISASTTIDSTYVSTNSCDDINITADATLTFTEAIDLGGVDDYTFTIESGVKATFDGAFHLSDSGDDLVVNGIITHVAEDTTGVDISAGTVTISDTGQIDVEGVGCRGGVTASQDGFAPDTGNSGACTVSEAGAGDGVGTHGTGGSYGGVGGYGPGQKVGAPYGPSLAPIYLGSGGGAGDTNDGGDGGGYISLAVSDTLTLNGTVNADGTDGTGSTEGSGGGSGGGVYITTDTLSGSGTISAAGGTGGTRVSGTGADNDGSGGSGGKVAVHYNTSTFAASNVTATAGLAGGGDDASDGDNGSVALVDTDDDTMAIQQGFQFADGEDYVRTSLTIGTDADLNCDVYSALTISTEGTLIFDGVDWECNTINSLSLTADTVMTAGTNTMSFGNEGATVDWNVSNDLTINNLTYKGGDAGTASGHGGYWTIDDRVALSLVNSTILSNVSWTNLSGFSLDANSSIVADGLGCAGAPNYADGTGPDTDTNICTISTSGYSEKALGTGGAGHGGAGGAGHTTSGGTTYDSTSAPVLYGSGAGGTTNPVYGGGTGGGVVRIGSFNTTTIDGAISVNGGDGSGDAATASRAGGGGSGGSIYVTSDILEGSGTVSATGGTGGARSSGTGSAGGGGGGGIIALAFVSNTDFDTVSNADASGGLAGTNPNNAVDGSDGVVSTPALTSPAQPTLTSPADGIVNLSGNPALTGSEFSDNGSGHLNTDWKVTTDSGGNTLVWSADDDTTNLKSIVVNNTNGSFTGALSEETQLAGDTTYYAFARYSNAVGDSSWSPAISFTTGYLGAASTQTWEFDTEADYVFSGAVIEFASSIARLIDQGGGTYMFPGLSGWSQSKELTIDNTGGVAETDFQVRVDVTHDADMQADFDDIRFTDSDGQTELDYFLESYVESTSAIFWVEVPTLPSNDSTTILMQYGNASATTTSSGTDTFVFYDDFETFSGWTNHSSGTVEQSSEQSFEGTYALKKDTANEPSGGYKSLDSTLSRNVYLEGFVYRPTGYGGNETSVIGLEDDSKNGYSIALNHASANIIGQRRSSGSILSNMVTTATGNTMLDEWVLAQIELSSSQVIFRAFDASYTQIGSVTANNVAISSFTQVGVHGGYEDYVDVLRIRKRGAVTPSVTTGSETAVYSIDDIAVTPSSDGDHPQVDQLFSMSHVLGENSAGTVYYQMGVDSDNDDTVDTWYYHDGGNWTEANDDATNRNTIDEVNTYIPDLANDASIASDQLFFKAILVSDGTQAVELDSITLSFNVFPLFTGSVADQAFTEDQTGLDGQFDLDDYFSDIDDTLSYSASNDLSASLGTMTINGDGTVDFSLAANANGTDAIQLRATDQTGATTDSNEITVNVTAVNDAPTLASIANKTVAENQQLQFTVTGTDPDADAMTLTAVDPSSHFDNAGVSVNSLFTDNGNGSGTFTWTPTFEQSGTYQLRFQVSDGALTATRTITVTVGNIDTDPSFSGTIANIALQSGQTMSNVFDLDAYFEDAEGGLTYGVTGNDIVTIDISDDGLVSVTAPEDFSGSEDVIFTVTDIDNNVVESDPVVITVTSSETETDEDSVGSVTGALKGEGVVTIVDKNGNELASWTAFPKGGAVPRVATVNGQQYVFVTKAQSGSSIKAYTLDGQYLGRKKLKLHWRRVTAGNLNKNSDNDEVVAFIHKGKRVQMKAFLFRPTKDPVFKLKKRKTFRGIKTGATVEISNRRVLVRNNKGRIKYRWRPFGKRNS